MKKIYLSILFFLLTGIPAFSAIEYTVEPIEGVKYRYYKENADHAEVFGYDENELPASVTIKSQVNGLDVTSIVSDAGNNSAFKNCQTITSIVIPNTITSITASAFSGCSNLTSVVLPNNITEIKNNTFQKCSSLKSIDIPNSVTSMGTGVFKGCSSLNSVVLPNTITTISGGTFDGCTDLTAINIPSTVTAIGYNAFHNCKSLASINIPTTVTSIGYGAFCDCNSLTSIDIPSSVTTIPKQAFQNCYRLTSLTIPASVTTIEEYAFSGCSGLTSMTCLRENPPTVKTVQTPTNDEYDSFYGFSKGYCTLYVPAGSSDAYKSATNWDGFKAYVEPGFTLSSDKLSLLIGQTGNLTLTKTDNFDQFVTSEITWSSSNNAVATVDQDGKVTAIKKGTAIITVQCGDITDSCTVTVSDTFTEGGVIYTIISNEPKEVSVTGYTDELPLDVTIPATIKSYTVTKIGDNAFKDCLALTYLTLPNSINNLGTAVFSGCHCMQNLTCLATTPPSANSSFSDFIKTNCVLMVPDECADAYHNTDAWKDFLYPVTGISIDPNELTLSLKETSQLTVAKTPTYAYDNVNWNSSDETVATVGHDGTVTTIGPGTAVITANCGEYRAYCTVKVAPVLVESIKFAKQSVELKNGESLTLEPEIQPVNATDKSLKWESNAPSIVTVDREGTITAVAAKGEAVITVTATDGSGEKATCTVTIIPTPAESITIETEDIPTTIKAGETVELTANIEPATTTDKSITWKSSNPKIATVNESGVVTAVGEEIGEVEITATNSAGQTVTITITVGETLVDRIELNSNTAQIKVGRGFQLIPTISPATATDKSVSWTTSDDEVVSVDNAGNILGLELGVAIITCTANDGSETYAECQVTVATTETESVTIAAEGATTLKATEKVKLTATVLPDTATEKAVVWQSDNTDIATVDDKGEVTAIAVGTTTITVTNSGGQTASIDITVVPTPAGSISLNKTEAKMEATETLQLIAALYPETTTKKDIEWHSDNESAATVTANGLVTAIAVGEALITATATDGSNVAATCKVTVIPTEVTGVSITANGNTTLKATETLQLTGTVTPATATNKSVVWKSSNPEIAEVNENGFVTAHGVGQTVITATSTSGVKAEITITVESTPATSISLDRTSLTMEVADKVKLTATVLPTTATDNSVTWTSTDPNIATVSADGTVAAVAAGQATITAQCGTLKATCTVNVLPVKVTEIKLNHVTAELRETETITLTAQILPANATDKTVEWISSAPGIVTVDQEGIVKAVANTGEAIITAKATDGSNVTATCTVKIVATAATGISISTNGKTTLKGGETVQLTATIEPATATDKRVKWTTGNNAVATVNESGLVTATGVGETTITATNSAGQTATIKITVIPSATEETKTPVERIDLNRTEAALKATETLQLKATVYPATATQKGIEWSSSNEAAATVNANGLVTAVAVGEAEITARAIDGSGVEVSCKVTVIPTEVTGISIAANGSTTLKAAETLQLTATVYPSTAEYKSVAWTSGNPEIADVDENGLVTAYQVGQTVVTATAASGVKAEIAITVAPTPATSIILSPTSITMKAGEEEQLTATVYPETATDKELTWTSTDTDIVIVDRNGKVTAVKEGRASVICWTADLSGVTATCDIEVIETRISSIALNESAIILRANETYSLIPDIRPQTATSKQLSWSVEDPGVATVSQDGIVTAIAVGETTVTASAIDGSEVTATCKVSVIPTSAEAIAITAVGSTTLEVNEVMQLTAEVFPAEATDKSVVWTSSNSAVAEVTQQGLVSALTAGESVITATNSAGQYDRVTITVVSKETEQPGQPEEPTEPTPKADTPTELLHKGDGTSHMFIAIMEKGDKELEALGYHYVFGYTNITEGSITIADTPLRYTRTTEGTYWNKDNDFWVLAYYIDEEGTVCTSCRRHLDGSVDCGFDTSDVIGILSGSSDSIVGIYNAEGTYMGKELEKLKQGVYVIKTTQSSYKIIK